jgi:hypothetical protein
LWTRERSTDSADSLGTRFYLALAFGLICGVISAFLLFLLKRPLWDLTDGYTYGMSKTEHGYALTSIFVFMIAIVISTFLVLTAHRILGPNAFSRPAWRSRQYRVDAALGIVDSRRACGQGVVLRAAYLHGRPHGAWALSFLALLSGRCMGYGPHRCRHRVRHDKESERCCHCLFRQSAAFLQVRARKRRRLFSVSAIGKNNPCRPAAMHEMDRV